LSGKNMAEGFENQPIVMAGIISPILRIATYS
jgi:hypothetical protein